MNASPPALRAFLLCVGPSVFATGCGDDTKADTGPDFNSGPVLEHTSLEGTVTEGVLEIRATATDPDGVAEVVVYHRPTGLPFWDLTQLVEVDGEWVADLTATAPGFDYYLRATDRFGAEGYLPAEADAAPWTVHVLPASKSVPFYEGFELEPGETSLYSLGWVTYSEGFAVYNWDLATSRAASGAASVFHGRGAVDGSEMKDWLVTPPIDFSGLDRIQVTWQESGANTSALGTHGLYISATGDDPTVEGTFEAVEAALPAPTEDGFARSAVIDLTEYAGESLVRLAWLYQGTYGDDWYIDDVRVEELTADLTASYLGQTPEPVFPGEVVHVDWLITNGSAASAANFEATLSLPSGGGTVDTPTQAVPTLEGYSNTTMGWDITLDPDVATDRYRPMELTITDGASTWTFEDQFLIGHLSTSTLSFVVEESAITSVVLGVGDPAAPDTQFVAYSGRVESGDQIVTDLTPYADLLPPTAGAGRWFARVQTDRNGSVTDFTISTGGVDYGGSESGGTLVANQPTELFVPRPPQPTVTNTDPTDAAPGDIDLPLTISMVNLGADSQGPVTGTLTTTDPDLTLTGGESLTIDPDVWTSGETLDLTGPLASISSSHTSSQPVRATLDLTDGTDAWTLPVDIQVPFPVLEVVATTIDDSGGDGRLDDGESVELELEIANMGDLATLGRMDVTATVSASSAVSATMDVGTDRLSSLSSGQSADIDLELSGVTGSPGEDLILDLSLDDGTRVYAATATITLGEPPWTTFATPNDSAGDSVDPSGTSFDFVNGRYRVYDANIEVILESSVPYDVSTLFIEAWGNTSGSPYLFYRWVFNSGVPSFQGYVNGAGWQPIGTLTVTEISPTEVMLSWPLEDMETITTSLSIGFGTMWCGPPEYYCDHFPDGWGYGYDSESFNPSNWYDLRW